MLSVDIIRGTMPKSRRAKVVPLTKTVAKGREHKEELVEKIRKAITVYPHLYVFHVHNVRTNILQQVRNDRRGDSKLFMGNNKVMSIALGRDAETSVAPNIFKVGKFLTGLCGLFFTTLPKKEVKEYFASIGGSVFARCGQPATADFMIRAGPLPQFPHSMTDQLRKLGLPLTLDKGVVTLLTDTMVCKAGEPLSAEAAQLLKLWGMTTAEFRMELQAHWTEGVARRIAGVAAQ